MARRSRFYSYQYSTPPWPEQVPLKCAENEGVPSLQVAVSPAEIGGTPAVQPQAPVVWCAQLPPSAAGSDEESVGIGAEVDVFVGAAGAVAGLVVAVADVLAGWVVGCVAG